MGVLAFVHLLAGVGFELGRVWQVGFRVEHQQEEICLEHVVDQRLLAALVELIERLAEALAGVVDDVELEQLVAEADVEFDLAGEGGRRWPIAGAQGGGDLVEELLRGGAVGGFLCADDVDVGVAVGLGEDGESAEEAGLAGGLGAEHADADRFRWNGDFFGWLGHQVRRRIRFFRKKKKAASAASRSAVMV